MDQIRPWLFIGKYTETRDLSLLAEHHIDAMLQLAEWVEHPDIGTLYLAVDDGEPLPFNLLRTGIDFIKINKMQGRKVLVACGAGISRSASFALAALKEIEGLNLLEALQEVKQHHPQAMPHPALWQSLCDYYDEDIPFGKTIFGK
jgi:hypothetical protein